MVCCGAGVQVRVVVLCRRIHYCHWRGDQFSGARDVRLAGGAGEQPLVTDAMEPFWQDVEEKAPNELEQHLDDAGERSFAAQHRGGSLAL